MAHVTVLNVRKNDPGWAEQVEQILDRLTRDFTSFKVFRDGDTITIFSERK
ncbi:MAG: hypothetical protein ACRD3E_11560 [Terriglobales bacterium]